ncbi:unnamed protein product, partial [Closterium sp. NIES-53]
SETASPPSVGGECTLGTDVLEDRQEYSKCLAAAVPRFASMLLAPEGDPDAQDILTPRSYAEAITGPYSSQWQAAMDAEMASWKSTGTYVDEVLLFRANIVDGMWIFRGVDFFPHPEGSLHEEMWLRRPPGFTGSFPPGTQWSLRRRVYGLGQVPREWHDTLRTTLAALGFAPSTADLSLFLCTDTSLPPFYVLVYVDDLVFATANTEALTLVKSELQKRHTCTDLGPSALRLLVLLATAHSSIYQPLALSSTFGRVRRAECTSGMGLVLGGRVHSSCEAEIYARAMAAQELRWLTYLLTDFGEQPHLPPQRGQLCLAYVATRANTADIFTKALPPACFAFLDWSCDHLFSPTLPLIILTCRAAPPRRLALPKRPAVHCPTASATTAAFAATTTTLATAPTAAMASPIILTFDAEGRAVDFDVWVDDLQLFLQCDSRDGVSFFDHTSGVSPAPAATADSTVRSQWTTRDAVAHLAVCSHLPSAERAHFSQYKTAQSLYDAVVARYSSPATAALSRLMLPYLFPELAAFATVTDLVAHLRTSDARYCAALPTEDHFLSLCPTELTVDLLEEHLAAAVVGDTAPARARGARVVEGAAGEAVEEVEEAEVVAAVAEVVEAMAAAVEVAVAEVVEAVAAAVEVAVVVVLIEVQPCCVEALVAASASSSCAPVRPRPPCTCVFRTGSRSGEVCGLPHTTQSCFDRLTDAWLAQFPDVVELPRWHDLLLQNVPIFDLDFDAILAAMYAIGDSADGDCYLSVPHDPDIAAAALGASASAAPDSTTLTPLSRPVAISLADPSGGLVLAHSSMVLPCPAAPSGLLSGLHLPSFSTNLVSGADLQDAWVDQFNPGGQRVTHCTCSQTGHHLATFTHRPGSSLYTLTTAPPPVSASGQVAASSQVFAAASRSSHASALCSCRPLSHKTLLWHHRLGHPSLPRLRGMASCDFFSGIPRSLPPLPLGPAPTCVPCVEGRQSAAPHSSSFLPTQAPLQTLHMDVWGPARVRGQGHERYFLLVVDDYSRYTTVFPLRSKGEIPELLIDWIRGAPRQLSEHFGSDVAVLRLHPDRGGEFSSDLPRAFCRAEGICQTFTPPASPQQSGISERRIGMVMDVTRTSMIQGAAPHFLWPFAVQCAAHQINLQPRVSLPETTPTLRWTEKVGDASAFRVWGSQAFVHDTTADKLSSRAVPSVFLGFPPDAPGWQFYHPTSCRVLSSQDVRFDESVSYYHLFPYRTASYPPSRRSSWHQCALGTDVLEDRQEDFECFAASVPHLVSMLLAPEGDPEARDIPTPRSYTEAIEGPYSSQWQAAMDAEMASWKSTGTYVDEVPPPGANIVSGMWIFRVKRPPSSLPVFKAHYVARGFRQRQGVNFFQTFSPTSKMTTLRVLLHVAAQRDYELHSLDFSTAFLQGCLHEEIWLRRPPFFTGSFPAGTQWSLRRPVYGLRQAPREWHDTLRTTLGALGFAPFTSDPSLFLRTDTTLPPFYILVYVDDLVFATAYTKALAHVKSELQKRNMCTDLGELTSYPGLRITRDRAQRTITLTKSHMVQQVLQRFGFTYSSPQSTPLPTGHSLSAPPSDESVEPSG